METEAFRALLRAGPGGPSPARQFVWLLGALITAGAVAATVLLGASIQAYFVSETAHVTVDAVTLHFQYVFGKNVFGAPLEGPTLEGFERMVRAHMNLYHIAHMRVFGSDGTIVFSYQHGEIGRRAPDGVLNLVRAAQAGALQKAAQPLDAAETADGRAYPDVLALYVPVTDGPEGSVLGVAAVYRDVRSLLAQIRRMQAAVLLLSFALAALLFLSLRRVYDLSTQQIRAQARALRAAVGHIEATYDATLEALIGALDARDNDTEGHSFRVCAYAVHLARQVGVEGQALVDLARGALLHDVGKIGIPDAILCKPGPLTEEEWAEMRRHPELGYRMLVPVAFLRDALPIVLHHQERWDGSGYPARLAGTDIPLGARTFAVADALDAITSTRPYRAARSFEAARQEIRRCAGTQFDPAVVEAYLAVPDARWRAIAAEVAGLPVGAGGLRAILSGAEPMGPAPDLGQPAAVSPAS